MFVRFLWTFIIGKALLLLNEDGFKERAARSGDVLYKALQQHHAWIKSLTSQSENFSLLIFQLHLLSIVLDFPYSFWHQFPYIRDLNFPFLSAYFPQAFHFSNTESSIRTRQISTSSSSSSKSITFISIG